MTKWILALGILLLPATGFAQQGTMANSAPVVIASDQTEIPVTGSVFASVAGTVTANQGTAVAPTASWPVSNGTITQTTGTISTGGVDCSTATNCVSAGGLSGMGSVAIQVKGTYSITFVVEVSFDNFSWFTTSFFAQRQGAATGIPIESDGNGLTGSNDTWLFRVALTGGISYVRVRAAGYTSGSADIIIAPAADPLTTDLAAHLRTSTGLALERATGGTDALTPSALAVGLLAQYDDVAPNGVTENNFGMVRLSSNRSLYFQIRDAQGFERGAYVNANNQLSISADSWLGSTAPTVGQKTMANSLPVTFASNQSALTITDGAGALNVIVDSSALPSLASTSTKQSDGTQKTQITDGTRDGTVKAASTLPALTDTAVVTTQRDPLPAGTNAIGKLSANSGVDIGDVDVLTLPNVTIGTFPDNEPFNLAQYGGSATTLGQKAMTASIPVTMASDQSTLPVSISAGNFPDNEPFNLNQVGGTGVTLGQKVMASSLPVVIASDQTAVPVSGTVTANPTTTNHLSLSVSESIAAPTATTWYLKRLWPLPASAKFIPSRAWASVTTAGSRTLIGVVNNMGNLNTGTNTFTDGNSVASPRSYARLIGCVTTVLSATLDTITVTYADELGNSQTTAAVSFAASTPVGNCFDFPLNATTGQMLDGGIRDITASADTAATTGVVTFYGLNPILDTLGVANAYETNDYDQGELSSAEQIAIIFQQAVVTAQQRNAGVLGSIR